MENKQKHLLYVNLLGNKKPAETSQPADGNTFLALFLFVFVIVIIVVICVVCRSYIIMTTVCMSALSCRFLVVTVWQWFSFFFNWPIFPLLWYPVWAGSPRCLQGEPLGIVEVGCLIPPVAHPTVSHHWRGICTYLVVYKNFGVCICFKNTHGALIFFLWL